MSQKQVNEIETICNRFLWGQKRPKIPLKVLQGTVQQGGLNLFNIEAKQSSLKIQWLKKVETDPKYQYVYEILDFNLKNLIWQCNLHKQDVKGSTFWHEVLGEWCKLHFQSDMGNEDHVGEILWRNSLIRINDKVLYNKKCIKRNMLRLADITDDNMRFLNYASINNKFPGCMTWYEYLQLVQAIPNEWCKLFVDNLETSCTTNRLELCDLIDAKKITRVVYKRRVNNIAMGYIKSYHAKVRKNVSLELYLDTYLKYFVYIKRITSYPRLYSFQYRLLINKIFTNCTLAKWCLKDSQDCQWCTGCKHTVKHMLFDCPVNSYIWNMVWNWLDIVNSIGDVPQYPQIFINEIGNDCPSGNLVVLITKYYLYRCFCRGVKPTVSALKKEIKLTREVELYNARLTDTYDSCVKKWGKIKWVEWVDDKSAPNVHPQMVTYGAETS